VHRSANWSGWINQGYMGLHFLLHSITIYPSKGCLMLKHFAFLPQNQIEHVFGKYLLALSLLRCFYGSVGQYFG
jgi:hypothetical protein